MPCKTLPFQDQTCFQINYPTLIKEKNMKSKLMLLLSILVVATML